MHRLTNFLLLKGWLIASFCCTFAIAEFTTVSLTGSLTGATLEHQVNLNDPNANGQDTITIRYTVPQTSWVAVGVNPTGTGMLNGEVVIGKPNDNNSVRKYGITARNGNAISELPNQTLINPSLQQSGGNTVLTYTKILDEIGEYAIEAGASNTFIAAFGFANNFGFHQGYGVQEVTLDAGTIATPTGPADVPTLAPTDSPFAVPTDTPVVSPTPAPLEDGFTQVPFGGALSYLVFRYRLNRNDINANGADTVSIKFTCPGNVWVGVGASQLGNMVPAKTVIGFPDSGDAPMQYLNQAREASGVTPLPEDQQVLIDSQITFANDETTLSYTIPVYTTAMNTTDEGLEVHADGRNQNFIFACGTTAAFYSFHRLYGSLETVIAESDEPVPAPVPVTPSPTAIATPAPVPNFVDGGVLPGKLAEATFRYSITRNDARANGEDTITIQFTCPGNVWVGVGVSQFGGMVPSKSVIGFPDSGDAPLRYFMEAQVEEGVTPLPEDQQNLIDPRIFFDNDRTNLIYTLPLQADNVFEIKGDGSNTNFIGACGTAAGPSVHQLYGSFGVAVKDFSTPPSPDAGFRQVSLSGSLADAEFQYRLNRNNAMAGGADTITIEYSCPGNVWVGVGVSEFGSMVPSKSVIGFPGSGNAPMRYKMEAQVEQGVTPLPDDQQTLIDPQVSFANDRTTLRYTIPIFPTGATTTSANLDNNNEALEIHANGRANNFIGACGGAAGPSFHQRYGSFAVVVEEGETEAPTVAAPFAAPTNPPGTEVLELTEDLAGSTLSYQFTFDDPNTGGKDSITVTYTAPVTAWVGVGVSESGGMVGSDAVIGIPATGEVKKYKLNSKAGDLSGVNVLPDDKQTLVNVAITQANGMTTLTYTKILVEDGEVPIKRVGDNIFIAAHGSSNTLGFHSAKGAFSLSGKVIERDNSLWALHGLLAEIAWGLFCPLAILAGLFRKYIPGQGRWYVIHRTLQGLAIVLTIAAVAVAIAALNKETPASSSANHFSTDFVDGHRLIGLVIVILAIVQGAGGIMRPHLPPKAEETTDADAPPPRPAEKSGARNAWEVFHRSLGVSLLVLTWYQIYLGIFWYYEIFFDGESESTLTVYYAVIGVFGGLILIGVLMRVLMG